MSKINKKIIFFLQCGLFSASYEIYCDQMNGDNGKSPSDENSCALLSGPNVHDDICCFYTLVDTSLSSGSNPIPQIFILQLILYNTFIYIYNIKSVFMPYNNAIVVNLIQRVRVTTYHVINRRDTLICRHAPQMKCFIKRIRYQYISLLHIQKRINIPTMSF